MSKDANAVEVMPLMPGPRPLPTEQPHDNDTPEQALWDEVTREMGAALPPGPPGEGTVPPAIVIGQTLGKCLLIERLGRGGSCCVYRALHQTLNVPVAVKVLQVDACELRHRDHDHLRSEARLLARLNHPNIVRILDFEDDAAFPYLVLECVEGPSLVELIHQSGRLRSDRARAIIAQVAGGLAAIWKIGAVHRDVKPGNILLARDGTAKIADLGQAVLLADGTATTANGSAGHPDQVAGTAAYMAPEQFLAPASVDHRADVYALGATFYQAITGRMPFEGRSRMEVLLKHAQEAPVPPHQLVADVDPALSDIILMMLAKDPDNRFQDSEELLAALGNRPAEPAVDAAPAPIPSHASEPARHEQMAEQPQPGGKLRKSRWFGSRPGPGTPIPLERPFAGNGPWLDFLRGTLTANEPAHTA